MNITRKTFLAAFEKVAPLAGKRTTIPILNCVRLEAQNGQLEIMASNLECFAAAKCEIDGSMKPICVSASVLGGLLKTAGEEVALEILKGDRLSFSSNGTAEIAFQSADEFPAFPKDKAKAIGIPTTDLAEAMQSVAWAALNKDDGRFILKTVWVKAEAKSLTCAATDGTWLDYINRPLICAECEFMVPSIYAGELAEVLSQEGATFALSDNYAIAESPSLVVASKLVDGRFPSVQQILNQRKNQIGDINLKDIIPAISTVLMVSSGVEFNPTVFSFSKDGIGIEFKSSGNNYKTAIPAKVRGESFRIDAARANAVFRHWEADSVRASLGECRALFLEKGDRTTVLMLLAEPKKEDKTK